MSRFGSYLLGIRSCKGYRLSPFVEWVLGDLGQASWCSRTQNRRSAVYSWAKSLPAPAPELRSATFATGAMRPSRCDHACRLRLKCSGQCPDLKAADRLSPTSYPIPSTQISVLEARISWLETNGCLIEIVALQVKASKGPLWIFLSSGQLWRRFQFKFQGSWNGRSRTLPFKAPTTPYHNLSTIVYHTPSQPHSRTLALRKRSRCLSDDTPDVRAVSTPQ
ncbi:hypothetical protein K439DRAFT_1612911 [Ramaria rubella]|nr:hypothetical protein K439DRAFT_1612911 [Ramaria rubella]